MRALGFRLPKTECGKQRAIVTHPLVVNSPEIFGTQQANTFRKTSDGELPLGADGELLSSTGATPRQHSTAILGLHPRQKAVGLRAAASIRLKSAFWHYCSSI